VKALDLALGIPAFKTYLKAVYSQMLHPHAKVSTWCADPARCPLDHRIVFIKPPHKPLRAGLKHIEV
jgi:hypothetical protein